MSATRVPALLRDHEEDLIRDWTQEQTRTLASQQGRLTEAELRGQAKEFLGLLRRATQDGNLDDVRGPGWQEVLDVLGSLSRSRARQGFTPAQTASFIFSLKRPLFALLSQEYGNDGAALAGEIWTITQLLDQLGLHTTEVFIKTRE